MFILPVNDENPVNNIPWCIFTLIAVNAIVLVLSNWIYSPEVVFQEYGFIPAKHELVTVLTSMFLHAGFWHFAGNMWFLWMFGNQVENALGPWLFALVYLICGFGGALLHLAFNTSSTIAGVGASGAISGIAGMYFVLFPKTRFDLMIYFGWIHIKTIPSQTRGAVGAWIAEQGLLGLLTQAVRFSSVAFWAHIGGFATGAAAALIFQLVVPAEQRRAMEGKTPWDMQLPDDNHGLTQLNLRAPAEKTRAHKMTQ